MINVPDPAWLNDYLDLLLWLRSPERVAFVAALNSVQVDVLAEADRIQWLLDEAFAARGALLTAVDLRRAEAEESSEVGKKARKWFRQVELAVQRDELGPRKLGHKGDLLRSLGAENTRQSLESFAKVMAGIRQLGGVDLTEQGMTPEEFDAGEPVFRQLVAERGDGIAATDLLQSSSRRIAAAEAELPLLRQKLLVAREQATMKLEIELPPLPALMHSRSAAAQRGPERAEAPVEILPPQAEATPAAPTDDGAPGLE